MHVGDMVTAGTLPQQLKVLLSHPQILKAGHLVDADLRYLQSACKGSSQFVGGLDLAKYAKDQQVVNDAWCSLADLCAWVLGKWLNKNISEQLSDAWEDDVLTSKQPSICCKGCIGLTNNLSQISNTQHAPTTSSWQSHKSDSCSPL